ncbi:SBBP repeat-containing protein [Clostridium sp. BSD9I1]|uniref:SBBP repeat-containing protein n=1 Tax=Clostridium sp. BSD9I1 TaxID=2003589 RepID=UPI001645E303|nr:SBBP repeat-containing protein [Clostridium sp. BSD9I1]
MENNIQQILPSENLIKNISSFFIKNCGQLDNKVKYYTSNGNFSCYLTSQEAIFSFVKIERTSENEGDVENLENIKGVAFYLKFLDANENVEILCQSQCSSKINYLKGNTPDKWYKELPTYEKIIYNNLWPNIDLVFYSVKGELKYEFVLYPNASLDDIKLLYLGVDGVALDKQGNMIISTALGPVLDKKPISYQFIEDTKVMIESNFVLKDKSIFNFQLEDSYDKNHLLVIDPGLQYSTYIGGNGEDVGFGIDVDNNGNAYVVGKTLSTDFQPTPGAFTDTGGMDAFVIKVNTKASGPNSLIYFTYLGGDLEDEARDIAIDNNGFAYITGRTTSSNFPTILSTAYQGTRPDPVGNSNAFITKLSADGSTLLYSSYLGGNNYDTGIGITVDDAGNAYIAGNTFSTNFPTTQNTAYQPIDPSNTSYDCFITKINTLALSGPASFVYSTYFGGNDSDFIFGIDIDDAGNAYVTGNTMSTIFPITQTTAYQNTNPSPGFTNGFVSKINTLKSGLACLEYSTYLGGNDGPNKNDLGQAIAVDNAGNVYITGTANSRNFPTTQDTAYQPTLPPGNSSAFVSKINTLKTGLNSLEYSTYLGGNSTDVGTGIATDNEGNAYVTGYTVSTNFPTTSTAYQPQDPSPGISDAFISKINTLKSGLACLEYSTYLGGNGNDLGQGISVDNAGNAYVTGETLSMNFPMTPSGYQPIDPSSAPNTKDAFLSKIATLPTPPLIINCPGDILASSYPGICGAEINFKVTASGGCGEITIVCNPESGSLFPVGDTLVTCTATDLCSNAITCSFTIIVLDLQPPVITCPGNMTIVIPSGQSSTVVNFTVTAIDNCDGDINVISIPPSGSSFPVGITEVTCTATDLYGNTESSSFNITIVNEQPKPSRGLIVDSF